jgi:hypothetical protein
MGLGRVSPSGETIDTIPAPTFEYDRSQLKAGGENGRSVRTVPFTAEVVWGFSPLGYVVGGVTSDYRIDLFRVGEPLLRIERDWTPVPIDPQEAKEQRDRITANLQRNYGSWRWNGPSIPGTKPPYRALFVDEDNRLWVMVSQEGREVMSEAGALEEERQTGSRPQRFREPPAFDVFDSEGRFLGHVRVPESLSYRRPEPIVRGERVWAVTRDELDVPYVVRFRMVRGRE